jgi:seryl-tRNA synthetase
MVAQQRTLMAERDFVQEVIEERTGRNPDFPALLEAAERRRALLQALAAARNRQHRTQTELAARMQSSQSSVARLETAAGDARLSTLDRYAAAVGLRIQWHLLPAEHAKSEPAVVVHSRP